MDTTTLKDKLSRFGRAFSLLLNRSLMYNKKHPFVRESIDDVQQVTASILEEISPLVFILNHDQFFVDEEPLDPRINVRRIATIFKNNGIQSISFEKGLERVELEGFIDIFGALTTAVNVETIREMLGARGIYDIRVNHVYFKKVTEDDQVISREALKSATPMLEADDEKDRRRFMDALIESVLSEEFAQTLNIGSLLSDPEQVSSNIIQADLEHGCSRASGDVPQAQQPAAGTGGDAAEPASSGSTAAAAPAAFAENSEGMAGPGATAGPMGAAAAETGADDKDLHGPLILQQLEMMKREVEGHLDGRGSVELADLAQAVFTMKRRLMEGIQTQKALGVAYANEAAIKENADQITDRVLIALIREEYRSAGNNSARLAMLIRRLVPDAVELMRLLPQIKAALLSEGLPLAGYLDLVREFENVFQGEGLAKLLDQSAKAIGIDGDTLLSEFKRNPDQAAEMIYLAAELRKNSGDKAALADILVEYLEQLGRGAARDKASASPEEEASHVKSVIADIESRLLRRLGRANLSTDMLGRIEERLNSRMDAALDAIRLEWLKGRSGVREEKERFRPISLLAAMESNVGADEELSQILQAIRAKVEAGEIGENDFSSIQSEIENEKKRLRKKQAAALPDGVLTADEMNFIIEKEIARAKRYGTPFSALAFALITAKPQIKQIGQLEIGKEAVVQAALELLARKLRDSDMVGRSGKNTLTALLPTINADGARRALSRIMKALHGAPLKVGPVPVQIRMAGVAATYDTQQGSEASAFVEFLYTRLGEMVTRVRNIQALV